MKKIQLIMILGILFSACSALEGEQKSNVNEVIKTQEIKQVSRTDILIGGEKYGKSIIDKLSNKVIEDSLCSSPELASDAIDSLADSFGGKILFGNQKLTFSTEQEQLLFDAYLYSEQNEQVSTASVQFEGVNIILYTQPVSCVNETVGMWSIKIPVKTIVNTL